VIQSLFQSFSKKMKSFPSELIYNGHKDKRKFMKWDQKLQSILSKHVCLFQEQTSIDAKPQQPQEIRALLAAGQNLNAQQSEIKFKCDDRIKKFEEEAIEAVELFKTSVGSYIKSDLLQYWTLTSDIMPASIVFSRMLQQTRDRHRGTPAEIQTAIRSIDTDIAKLSNAQDDSEVQQQFIILNDLLFELASFGQPPLAIARLQEISTVILEHNQFHFERALINTIVDPPQTLSQIIMIWSNNAEKARRFGQTDSKQQKSVFSATVTQPQQQQFTSSSSSSSESSSPSPFVSGVQYQSQEYHKVHQENLHLRKIVAERNEEIFHLRSMLQQFQPNAGGQFQGVSSGGGGGRQFQGDGQARWNQQQPQSKFPSQAGQQSSSEPRYFQPRLPPSQPQFHQQFNQQQPHRQQQQQQQQQRFQQPPLPFQPPPPRPSPPSQFQPPPSWSSSSQPRKRERPSRFQQMQPGVFGASIEQMLFTAANEEQDEHGHQQQHDFGETSQEQDETTPDQWPLPSPSNFDLALPSDWPPSSSS